MTQKFLIAILGATALVSGCATKGYVRQNVTPVQDKLNQVADQVTKQGGDIQKTQQDVQKNTQAISATEEKLSATDRRANDAMTSANKANDQAQKDDQEIAQLRGVISNLDDYKVSKEATVHFKFNSAVLSNEDKMQLDDLAAGTNGMKRYFIAVEGYTDTTGPANYNLELSRRRAEAVVVYLSAEKKVPFYQIRTIGLGENNLVDNGKTADARAKNRRVEVKIFSADTAVASAGGSR
ncbi:MAG TPA: OmpA family protein [Candidatus Acidoferrales bacterium]|jgi:outer membrane protein OmpA-like peptidoglycan-associated protein|nr:OmpA family protein [Candidatus Acidoferrales bacterium]